MQVTRRECKDLPQFSSDMAPLLQRIYAARGITNEEQLDKSLKKLLPFDTLTDIDKACARLEAAFIAKERILIIGDFDADGATSTTLAVLALRSLGAGPVDYLVPNRFQFGYGLTPGIVEVAKKWRPHVIVTVDNGIASFDGVQTANDAGIDVIVTDHHLPSDQLPPAYAIVNPNRHNDDFSSKSIAGVGVIFYLMMALRRHLINREWFTSNDVTPPNMADFLDLVALGTVADVVSLDHNNRIMVSQGLKRIRQGLCRPGIQALIEIAGRSCKRLRESDLGFAVAPRLNAAGRLDDMSLGIECLLAPDASKAQMLAVELNELNAERRQIEAEMKEQALAAINKLMSQMEEHNKQKTQLPAALCLFDETWHQGVIGILAGRLKERYHRPVIVFSLGSDNEVKGSARSVPSLNIRDVLAAVDKDNPGLIIKFGGHAMAAGLSLKRDNFQAFKDAFVTETARNLNLADCEGLLQSDGALRAEEITIEMAELLQQAGPWGQQFPEPCFDNEFEILAQRLVGQFHLKLTLAHPDNDTPIDAIAFNVDLKAWPNHRAKKLYAVYKLDINVYQERSKLQLMIEAMQAV